LIFKTKHDFFQWHSRLLGDHLYKSSWKV